MDPIYEAYIKEMTMVDQDSFYRDFADYVMNAALFDFNKYSHHLGFYTRSYSRLYRGWSHTRYDEFKDLDIRANKFLATTTSVDVIGQIMYDFDAVPYALVTLHSGKGVDVKAVLRDAKKNYSHKDMGNILIRDAWSTYQYQDEVLLYNKKSKITQNMVYGFYNAETQRVERI